MFRLNGLRNHLRIGFVFLVFFYILLFNNVSAQEFSSDKIPPQFQAVLPSDFDIESLTPDQRKAIESELSKKDGQAPPESEEMAPEAGETEETQTGLELIQIKHEEKGVQPLERFGLAF